MHTAESALKIISEVGGVIDVFIMDDDLSHEILVEERSVVSKTGMGVINKGYEDALGRKYRACAIVIGKDDFSLDAPTVIMINSKGETVGTALLPHQIPEYMERDDVVWVSEDFVLFRDADHDGGDQFVLPAPPLKELDRDGICDAIIAFPCTTAGEILKSRSKKELPDNSSALVIAFNIDE